MASKLFVFSRSIPAPFDKVSKTVKGVSSQYGDGTDAKLCATTVKAVMAYAQMEQGTTLGGLGQVNGKNVVEYKSATGNEYHLVAHDPSNGNLVAGVFDTGTETMGQYVVGSRSRDGAALLLALIPTLISDNEFKNNLEQFCEMHRLVIDPTVTSAKNLYNAHDTYIYDGGGDPGGTGDRMYVGIKTVNSVYKVHRSYWRVITLPSLGSNYSITSASFIVQHPAASTSRPFSLYGVNGSWNEGTITWANKPGETLLVSGVDRNGLTVTFSGTSVTQRVKDWYSGAAANNGFMIRYTSESLTNPDYNSFWSCDGTTASYVPYISITYTVPTSNVYYIKNIYYGTYLTANGSTNLSSVIRTTFTGNANQKWELVSLGGNQYRLVPQNATGCSLGINPETNVDGNPTVIRTTNTSSAAQKWNLVASGGGYKIVWANSSTGKVLEPSTATSNVVLFWDTGSYNEQRWVLEPATAAAAFIWPLSNSSGTTPSNFTITSPFGFRIYGGAEKTHKGIDVSASEGTRVNAMAAGTVTAGFDSAMGHYVRVAHSNGYTTHYQHLKAGTKLTGGSVEQGNKIAETGDSGSPGSYHLHLNIYKGSVSDSNLINALNRFDSDDIRGPNARNQTIPQPLFKSSGSTYVFNTSYNLNARDAYWNGNDSAQGKTVNLYSRYNSNPIANAYP